MANPAPPDCRRTPCGSRAGKPRFDRMAWEVYRRWRLCRELRIAPRPGSLDEQDRWEMEMFRILFDAHRRFDEGRRARDGAAALARIFGGGG